MMIDKVAAVRKLNNERARLGQWLNSVSMMNRPLDPEKQIKADAEFRLTYDRYMKANADYNTLFASLTTDELERLTRSPLDDMLAKCDPNAPLPEEREWVDAPAVGREII